MIVVVMGVCGSGKTSVGRLIAERMDWTFVEGDDLHPEANLRKMAAGTPLTDEDRRPWLDRIAGEMRRAGREGRSMVVACSALRRIYRDRLRSCGADVRFVHLAGAPALLRARMARREGHFMPPGLLDSQLATLEPAGPGEVIHELRIAEDMETLARTAIRWLGARRQGADDRGARGDGACAAPGRTGGAR